MFFVLINFFSPQTSFAAVRDASVTISPTTVSVQENTTYTYTITSSAFSTANIGSVEIQIPTDFSTPTINIFSTSPNRTWALSSTGGYANGFNSTSNKIGIKASGSSSKLDSNEFVTIQIVTTAPSVLDSYEWTASVWANLDFSGEPPFTITSAQPSVSVIDTTPPTITLTGSNPQTILIGQPYIELGAIVTDNVDTNLSATIDASSVNINQVGSYIVTYDVVDVSLNQATQVTRTINVVDQEAPVITLIGDNPQTIEIHNSYTELSAMVSDNVDIGLTATIDTSLVNTEIVGTYLVTYKAVDSSLNQATEITRTINVIEPVIVPVEESTVVVIETQPETISTNLSALNPQTTITSTDKIVNITVENDTIDPSINLSSLVTAGSGTIPKINIASSLNISLSIPSTTITSADANWNGIIALPKITTIALPETSGELKTLSTAIEVGSADTKLSFTNAVRILFTGEAGKKIGFSRAGTSFTEITNVCIDDSQATGDALTVDGDCKIDVSSDLAIWTKHFTTFATYTTTSISPPGGGSIGGGGYYLVTAQNISNNSSNVVIPATLPVDISVDSTVATSNTNITKSRSTTSQNKKQNQKIVTPKLETDINKSNINPNTLTASAISALPENTSSSKVPMILGISSVMLLLFLALKFLL